MEKGQKPKWLKKKNQIGNKNYTLVALKSGGWNWAIRVTKWRKQIACTLWTFLSIYLVAMAWFKVY